jgi:osmotically-inducible protein OsmY
MNKIFIFLLSLLSVISGCTALGVSTAEMTGVALFHDRRRLETIAIDETIESDASVTLNFDNDIRKSAHFNITAYNGMVLMTGEVPSPVLRLRMEEIVKSLNSVKLVKNYLTLENPTSYPNRSYDTFLTAKIKLTLSQNPQMVGFDTARIKVVTENKRVFLMGLVDEREAAIAVAAAQKQYGVREVIKVFEYI